MNVLKLRLNYQNDVRIIWIYPYYNQMILCSFFQKPSQFKPLFSAFAKVPDTRWHQQALTTRPGLFLLTLPYPDYFSSFQGLGFSALGFFGDEQQI